MNSENARTKSAPMKLTESVAYADGAIVSKTILKADRGTITLFAFDAGQGLSEHTAPFDAVVHVLEGEVELTVGGEDYVLGAGEMLIMPAQVPHAIKPAGRFKMLLTMIRS